MKLIAVFLLFFVAFASAQTNFTFSALLTDLTTTPLVLANTNNISSFTYTQSSNQIVTVTVSTDGDSSVSVCLSEYALSNSGCPAEGFIPASDDDDDSDVEFYGQEGGAKRSLLLRSLMEDGSNDYSSTASLTGLRYNTEYYVSANLTTIPSSDNETVTVTISWTPCPAQNTGFGQNCNEFSAPTSIPASGSTAAQTIAANGTLFTYDLSNTSATTVTFSFDVSSVAMTESLLEANESLITTYIRRGAFPVTNVNGTWTPVAASDEFTAVQGNQTYTYTMVGPEEGMYYIFVVPNNASVSVVASSSVNACPTGLYPTDQPTSAGQNLTCIAPYTVGGVLTNTSIVANGTTFLQSFPASSNIAYYLWTTSLLQFGVANSDSGDDAPYIYASYTGVPLSASAAFSSTNEESTNYLSVQTDSPVPWVIAVEYPSSISATQFQVWAGTGCANNCSGHGEDFDDDEYGVDSYCNSNAGLCNCASGYSGFDCGGKKLKTVYIVLIAIGGAIVLAIAIGVPIGCYIKNRKRARYERV